MNHSTAKAKEGPNTKTTRSKKAINLLREKPFNFVDFGKGRRGPLPEEFKNPKQEQWIEATAIMALLRTKPPFWQWTAARIKHAGRFSDRAVRRGMSALKRAGWVQHVNVYDQDSQILATFILVFSSPIPEEQRKGRFVMLATESGWQLRVPGKDGHRNANISEVQAHQAPPKEKSLEGDMSVHPPYGHLQGDGSRTQTLKRVQDFDSQDSSESTCPEGDAKHLADKLVRLGQKKYDSEEATLAYEEFIVQSILPGLQPPPLPKEGERRRKVWNLTWVNSSLIGLILLRMSKSDQWDNRCARRLIRRLNEGYISIKDIRILLFSFEWRNRRCDRWTLERMTFYGKVEGELHDGWKKWMSTHRYAYRHHILGTVKEQRNRLFPANEEERFASESSHVRLNEKIRELATKQKEPDEKQAFVFGVNSESGMAHIFSYAPRSEKTEAMIADAREELKRYFATNYTGVLIFQPQIGRLEELLGITPNEVRKLHREHVDKLQRRLSYHGLPTKEVVPII